MDREEYENLKLMIEEEYQRKIDALAVLFPEFHERPEPKKTWKVERTRKNNVEGPSKEELEDLYLKQGKTIDEVAAAIGKSSSTVRRMLINEGIRIRPRGFAGSKETKMLRETGKQPPQGSHQGKVRTLADMSPEEQLRSPEE